MAAKTIMIQGTASHVGKSVLTAALCRIFKQDGYRVAPFKSQNMALNSFVTKDGGEIGLAQAVQAEAAGLEPSVDMNPILLKPTGHASSQVVVLGRPAGNLSARGYHTDYAPKALAIIEGALNRLRAENDLVVIEGAGSPAEVNLQEYEIVNMRIARMASSPVLLVADIDKGGALASVVGTLELLSPEDRARVAGIIINKFRGDINLFKPAVEFLENKTGKPVVGVVPFFQDFRIPEEDTIPEDLSSPRPVEKQAIVDICVIKLPHISNFTDFDPLNNEPDVSLRYVNSYNSFGKPDLIILPGCNNPIGDMAFLTSSGLASMILEHSHNGTPVIGIGGGYQMLGREINDPLHTESEISPVDGLGLLDISTTLSPDKITAQVEAEVTGTGLFLWEAQNTRIYGYEINRCRTELAPDLRPAFTLLVRSGEKVFFPDGAVSQNGLVFGTYIHGIFNNDYFRRLIIDTLHKRKGKEPLNSSNALPVLKQRDSDLNKLADVVRTGLDMKKIYSLLEMDGVHATGKHK